MNENASLKRSKQHSRTLPSTVFPQRLQNAEAATPLDHSDAWRSMGVHGSGTASGTMAGRRGFSLLPNLGSSKCQTPPCTEEQS